MEQDKALDYLKQYKKAESQARYLYERCLVLRSQVESATGKPPEDGWTGRWEGKSKLTKEFVQTTDPNLLIKPKKVYATVGRGNNKATSSAGEALLCKLIIAEERHEQALDELEDLANEISNKIDRHCEHPGAEVLKQMYLNGKSYAETAEIVGYSYAHIRRMHWDSLDDLGRGLIKDELS